MLCASVTKDQASSSMLLLHNKVIVVQLSCGSVVTWLQGLFLSLVEGGGRPQLTVHMGMDICLTTVH